MTFFGRQRNRNFLLSEDFFSRLAARAQAICNRAAKCSAAGTKKS
jgi:hypothetical protein